MKFGPRPVTELEDCILGHSIKLRQKVFKKGRKLSRDDIVALKESAYDDVIVATLEDDDVHEDNAVATLSNALAGDNINIGKAFTGRCNLHAADSGLLTLNVDVLNDINLIHESITVATLAPYAVVSQKQMVATIKAIPFSVHRDYLDQCIALAEQHAPIIRVLPFRQKTVGFVQTSLPGTKESVLDKTTRVLEERLMRVQCTLKREIRCAHTTAEVAKAITQLREQDMDMIIVAGASAVVDRRDIVPAGVEQAGGTILHFGMPVDPGNLLLLGEYGNVAVLGMPGCARSPKENGFDWVLDRLVADVPVTARDIMAMGVGGLLKEIPNRIQPRAATEDDKKKAEGKVKFAAIVLAAGKSSRMGETNKLLVELDEKAMVEHVVDAIREADIEQVVVVTGHENEKVEKILKNYPVQFVHNPDYAHGISTSLMCGLKNIEDVSAVLICLGDMPRVTGNDIKQILGAFDPVEGREICVPIYHGKRGNPILWSRRFFAEMAESTGDVGARRLLGEYDELVCEVVMEDSGILVDFDTEQALIELGHDISEKTVD